MKHGQKAEEKTIAVIFQLILVVIIIPLLPILISRRWDWWEAWAFAVIVFLGFVLSRALAARRHPGLLSERSDSLGKEDAKPWDRILAPAMAFGVIIIPITQAWSSASTGCWSPSAWG